MLSEFKESNKQVVGVLQVGYVFNQKYICWVSLPFKIGFELWEILVRISHFLLGLFDSFWFNFFFVK